MSHNMRIPANLGFMVLPGAVLLPGTLLPLYIFEPRYRAMLAECLESHRIFGVSSSPAADEHPETTGIAGVGFVRACVANPNGTSNLVLQGIGRVNIQEWNEESVYPMARIEPVELPDFSRTEAAERRVEILKLITRREEHGLKLPTHFLDALTQTEDPGNLADLGAGCLIEDPLVRQSFLEELHPLRRMEALIDRLQKELPSSQ